MLDAITGFDWDTGNWPKCGRHGVSKAEIEAVFQGSPLIRPDRTAGLLETRYNAVGMQPSGRHVFVVFTIRETVAGPLLRPISARYMHRKEREQYERSRES